MDYLKIIYSAFGSMIAVFMFTKIMGNREMSQLSMFDYVSSITIGSIAGEMAVMSTDSFFEPLLAMAIFTIFTVIISYFTCKSIKLRRFIEGQSLLLFQNGQIFEKNLLKAKLDIDELLTSCRLEGYYDLKDIHTIYLEPSGMVSILPMAAKRPVTPSDMNLSPAQTVPLANVIIDGRILYDNLKSTGKDDKWLNKQILSKGAKDIKEIILATYDFTDNSLNIYLKFHRKMMRDIFE